MNSKSTWPVCPFPELADIDRHSVEEYIESIPDELRILLIRYLCRLGWEQSECYWGKGPKEKDA
jgi:hypothetical protein